ncbi:MAG: hypothetical protein EPO21_14505 [Chloroflexota bacterium]|nr:MAG: hypothetical protein EPO21_14505 [Chloroflexota bacterium]
MNTKPLILIVLLVLVALSLSACAPGANQLQNVPPEGGAVAGFWLGLWQGVIAPITFVISIFRSDINVYEVHNNGIWYNLGFLLGAGVLLGGGSHASRR